MTIDRSIHRIEGALDELRYITSELNMNAANNHKILEQAGVAREGLIELRESLINRAYAQGGMKELARS